MQLLVLTSHVVNLRRADNIDGNDMISLSPCRAKEDVTIVYRAPDIHSRTDG